jgi:cold shock CspA family protein
MANTVYKGVLKTWKDNRGFGFIQPENGDKDIFVHVSSLKGMARRPNRGDVLYYEIAKDDNGKYKAINARIEGVPVVSQPASSKKLWFWLSGVILLLASAAAATYLYQP